MRVEGPTRDGGLAKHGAVSDDDDRFSSSIGRDFKGILGIDARRTSLLGTRFDGLTDSFTNVVNVTSGVACFLFRFSGCEIGFQQRGQRTH